MTQDVKIRLSLDGAGQVQAGVVGAADSLDKLGQAGASVGGSMRMADASVADLVSGLSGMRAIISTLGVGVLASQVLDLGNSLLQAQVRAESLATALKFATGGNSAREIDYLRKTTNALGLDFDTTAKAYAKFAAASKETALEGEGARRVFEAVAKASSVMGLTAEENSGAMLALSQIISKGTVSAEELRGQLGERLPGAFQIAARAMGTTTGELGKLLEQGLLPASEFLPKFAAQLEKELGGAALEAAERTEASVNRLANAWEKLKQTTADAGVSDFMAGQYRILTDALDNVSNSMLAAKASGGGFAEQLIAGNVAVAQFLNPLNAFSYSVQDAGAKLALAEADLDRLKRGLQENPGNILIRGMIRDTEELIVKLREAREARDNVAGSTSQSAQFAAASSGIGALAKQGLEDQAKAAKALADARNAALGVNASYVKQITELNTLRVQGLITEREYVKVVQDLTAKTYAKTNADKGAAVAGREMLRDVAGRLQTLRLEAAQQEKATEGQRLALKVMEDLRDGKLLLSDIEKRRLAVLLEEVRAEEAAAEAMKKALDIAMGRQSARAKEQAGIESHLAAQRDLAAQSLKAVKDRIASLEDEEKATQVARAQNVSLAAAIEMVTAARIRERLANLDPNSAAAAAARAELAERERLLASISGKDARDASAAAASAHADEWQRINDQVGQSLSDALMEGGRSAADYIKGLFRNMVLRPIIQGAMSPVSGAVASLMSGGAGRAGAGWSGSGVGVTQGSLGYVAGGLYGLTGMSSGASAASLTYANAVGAVGGDSLGALIAANGNWSGVAAGGAAAAEGGAAAGAAAGAGSGGMSALAAAGWAAVIVAVLYAIFGDHSKWSMGSVAEREFEPDGSLARTRFDLPYQFGNNTEHQRDDKATAAIADQIGASVAASLQTFGGSASGLGFSVRTDADREGEAAAIISILRGGQVLGGTQTGSGAFGSVLPEVAATKIAADQLDEWFGTAMPQIIVQALQQSDLEDRFDAYFDSVAAGADLTAEKASELLQTASAVKQISDAFTPLGGVFSQLSTLAVSTVADFAKAAGGFDSLAAATQTYYQAFYTEAERTEITTAGLQRAFADVGLVLPDVSAGAEAARLALRAMVDSQDLSTEAGQKAAAVMLQTSGAIGTLIESALRAEEEASQRAAQIADKRTALEIELLRAQGNELGAVARERELELAALRELDPALVGLQQSIWDTIETTEAAARAAEAAKLLTTRPDNRLTTRSQIDTAASAILESIDMGELMSRVDITKAPQRWLDHLASGDAGWDEAFVRQSLAINQRVSEMIAARSAVVSEDHARAMAQLGQSGGISTDDITQQQLSATRDLISTLDSLESSLADYTQSLLLGDLSALAPEQQYAQARAAVDQALGQSRAGDLAAMEAAQGAVDAFLRASKTFNGSTEQYGADFSAAVAVLEEIKALSRQLLSVTAAGASATESAVRDGNEVTAQSLAYQMLDRSQRVE